jgi:hypothetical protein
VLDSLADDYIHRPLQKEFEDICFYDMKSQYKKYTRVTKKNPFKHMSSVTVIQDIKSFIQVETFNYTKDSISTKQTMFFGRT